MSCDRHCRRINIKTLCVSRVYTCEQLRLGEAYKRKSRQVARSTQYYVAGCRGLPSDEERQRLCLYTSALINSYKRVKIEGEPKYLQCIAVGCDGSAKLVGDKFCLGTNSQHPCSNSNSNLIRSKGLGSILQVAIQEIQYSMCKMLTR